MARTRSLVGCWICRVRRKKCDERRPTCHNCSSLEIECLFGDNKPEWMDGGKKQKERAEWLKLEVKRKAGSRRERRYLQALENEMDVERDGFTLTGTMDDGADGDEDEDMVMVDVNGSEEQHRTTPFSTDSSGYDSVSVGQTTGVTGTGTGIGTATTTAASTLLSPATATSSSQSPPTTKNPNSFNAGGSSFPMWPQLGEIDMNFLMLYLDFVFPFLFPFYRPPFLHAGRGWLLNLLTRNKSLLHGALGVASHFWTVITSSCSPSAISLVPSGPGSGSGTGSGSGSVSPIIIHQACKNDGWNEMAKQQELVLQELQRDMQGILLRGGIKGHHPVEACRVLGSIVQVLTFEVAIANTGNWQIHLDAAVEVFSSIMDHCSSSSSSSSSLYSSGDMEQQQEEQEDQSTKDPFSEILTQLGHPPSVHTIHNRPWTSDQASFRFFTACLLYYDTIASTSLDQPPRLQRFHSQLLLPISNPTCGPNHENTSPGTASNHNARYPTPHISLTEFLGIQNWTILAIGRISSLSSWKKSQRAKGQLSVTQLVSRANEIETYIRNHMAGIDIASLTTSTPNNDTSTSTPITIPLPCPSSNPINPNPLDPLQSLTNNNHTANATTTTNENGEDPLAEYIHHATILPSILPAAVNGTTYIFAQSALTYLNITTSGWQFLSPEIRGSVQLTLALLKALPTRSCIRTCIWPFTITGCLALDGQEEELFGEFVESLGPLGHLGSLWGGLEVMRGVWEFRRRNQGDKEGRGRDWDFDFGKVFSGGLLLDGEGGGDGGSGEVKRVLLV